MCQCERESEVTCIGEVIKNGSVSRRSPCRHPIHSCSRLHALWHYLRPEELGFLTVDTGQMESGSFIVQQQLFLQYSQHPQIINPEDGLSTDIFFRIIQYCFFIFHLEVNLQEIHINS